VFLPVATREIRGAVRAELLEHELRIGLQLVFVHARLRVAHGFDDAQAGDARGFAQLGDLARALGAAQLVKDRIQVRDLGTGQDRFQLLQERLLARGAAIPRIVLRGPREGRGIR